jgi:alginate O-acetyltransferase complex protein AlgI
MIDSVMSFTSLEYILFLLACMVPFRLAPARSRPLCLLLLSCIFYASWDMRGLVLLAIATALAYGMAFAIERTVRPGLRFALTATTVVLLTALLLLFKVLPGTLRPLSWLVPLGISYYTFKLLSYVIDVYWEQRPAERDFIGLAAYAAFFPQIIAGPIQRSEDFLPQLANPRRLTGSLLLRGLGRISFGLFKKLAVADQLAIAVNAVYAHPHTYHGGPLLAAFYLFPLQLYADFSGLTDIAIGSALLLGIYSPENFNRPFSATSISEYWRRWHMSLTNWLVDYVFTPLRMALRHLGTAGLVIALTVNMTGIGLWHGIAWGYLVFGLLHAAFLSADALLVRPRTRFLKLHPEWNRPLSIGGWIITFHAVALGMVFFRAQSVGDGLWLLGNMWDARGMPAFIEQVGAVSLANGLLGYAVFEFIDYLRDRGFHPGRVKSAPLWIRWTTYGACAGAAFTGVLLFMARPESTTNFIYAIF